MHLFDGGMQEALLVLVWAGTAHRALCNEAVHTSQETVHPLYVVGAPYLHTLTDYPRCQKLHVHAAMTVACTHERQVTPPWLM